jgi:hypothetical protein
MIENVKGSSEKRGMSISSDMGKALMPEASLFVGRLEKDGSSGAVARGLLPSCSKIAIHQGSPHAKAARVHGNVPFC